MDIASFQMTLAYVKVIYRQPVCIALEYHFPAIPPKLQIARLSVVCALHSS